MNALHYIERFMYDALLPIRTDLRKASQPFLDEADSLQRSIFFGKKLHTVLICKNFALVLEKSESEKVKKLWKVLGPYGELRSLPNGQVR